MSMRCFVDYIEDGNTEEMIPLSRSMSPISNGPSDSPLFHSATTEVRRVLTNHS